MNLLELIERAMNKPGTEPLSLAERAEMSEAIRRRDAWMVFMEYHHNATWAREDAERKIAENAYLPPEAVEYMQGEIKRRVGREALRKVLEQEAKEQLEAEHGKRENNRNSQGQDASANAGRAPGGEVAERRNEPDAGRDAADNRSAAGEGKEGPGRGSGVRQGESPAKALEPDIAQRTTAGDTELARELQAPGRGHEGQPAADAPAQETHSEVDGTAYGVGGQGEGSQDTD